MTCSVHPGCVRTDVTRHMNQFVQVSHSLSLSLILRCMGLYLYTVNVLFYVEWCIRQLLSSSIISYNITSIAYNYYTDIYSLVNIHIILVQVGNAMAAPVMKWLQKTPQEGAYSSLHCAVTAQVVETALDLDNKDNKKVGGEHYFNCQVVEQGEGVRSDDAKRLWTVSEEYVGEKFDF